MNGGVNVCKRSYLQEGSSPLLPTTDSCVWPCFSLPFFLEVVAPMVPAFMRL